jgi:isopentenyldiphosphate isomerase
VPAPGQLPPPVPGAGDAGSEPVDLVDEINRIVGRTSRREVRTKNLLHRGVGILCRDGSGRLHVHRRTNTKDVFPGMYDMFVGGVVSSGESYLSAARREIAEELGIVGPEPEFLFAHLYLGDRNRSWIYVYQVRWDGPVRLQPEEIVWGDWVDEDTLDAMIREQHFVPDGLEIYSHLTEWRRGRPPPA